VVSGLATRKPRYSSGASGSAVRRPLHCGGNAARRAGHPAPRNGSHRSHRKWCFGVEQQGQTNHAAPVLRSRQCVKKRIAQRAGRSESVITNPGRRHRWLIPHLSTSRSNADCRPLLQQSSPNRGRVVSSDTDYVRLNRRHSVCTATGAPGEPTNPHLERSAPGASASGFTPLLSECS